MPATSAAAVAAPAAAPAAAPDMAPPPALGGIAPADGPKYSKRKIGSPVKDGPKPLQAFADVYSVVNSNGVMLADHAVHLTKLRQEMEQVKTHGADRTEVEAVKQEMLVMKNAVEQLQEQRQEQEAPAHRELEHEPEQEGSTAKESCQDVVPHCSPGG